jgi:hypothetical protein
MSIDIDIDIGIGKARVAACAHMIGNAEPCGGLADDPRDTDVDGCQRLLE